MVQSPFLVVDVLLSQAANRQTSLQKMHLCNSCPSLSLSLRLEAIASKLEAIALLFSSLLCSALLFSSLLCSALLFSSLLFSSLLFEITELAVRVEDVASSSSSQSATKITRIQQVKLG